MPEDDKTRAVHGIAKLDVGGAPQVVRRLATALTGCGVDVSLLKLRDGPLRHGLEAAGIRVHVVPGRTRSMVRDLGATGELLRIRRDVTDVVLTERADIIQTHLLGSMDFLMLGVG